MFTRPKNSPEEPTDLPEGYDDPDSRYFIPENRRAFYLATAKPTFSEVLERAEWLIRQEAAEQVDREDHERGELPISSLTGRPRERDPRVYAERRQSRAEQIRRSQQEEYVVLARHELRAGDAERAARDEEAQRQHEAQYNRDHLCPTCQTVQPSTRPRSIQYTARNICDDCERRYQVLLTEAAMASADAATLGRIRADLPGIQAT